MSCAIALPCLKGVLSEPHSPRLLLSLFFACPQAGHKALQGVLARFLPRGRQSAAQCLRISSAASFEGFLSTPHIDEHVENQKTGNWHLQKKKARGLKIPLGHAEQEASRSRHLSRQESPMLRMLRGALGISLKSPSSELQCGSTAANKSVRERTPFREGMENKNTARRNSHVQSVRTVPAWQCCSDYQTSRPDSEISRQPACRCLPPRYFPFQSLPVLRGILDLPLKSSSRQTSR